MNEFIALTLHNSAVALVLSLFVLGITKIWRNPPLAHVLWVLVLIKLVVPPVWRVDWSALLDQAPNVASQSDVDDRPSGTSSFSAVASSGVVDESIGRLPNESVPEAPAGPTSRAAAG